jgi:hypothetical protein
MAATSQVSSARSARAKRRPEPGAHAVGLDSRCASEDGHPRVVGRTQRVEEAWTDFAAGKGLAVLPGPAYSKPAAKGWGESCFCF